MKPEPKDKELYNKIKNQINYDIKIINSYLLLNFLAI